VLFLANVLRSPVVLNDWIIANGLVECPRLHSRFSRCRCFRPSGLVPSRCLRGKTENELSLLRLDLNFSEVRIPHDILDLPFAVVSR
jgi:hypothetical protein